MADEDIERVKTMLLHWIWFAELKDISLLHKHRLLERFGDLEELHRMSEEALLHTDLPERKETPFWIRICGKPSKLWPAVQNGT